MTAEDWAPYGIGEPDADGWYPDYRPVPEELRPAAPSIKAKTPRIDGSWLAIVKHWRLMAADLSQVHGIDLHDPAVLARPWPGVRTMIFSLLDSDTRIRRALTVDETEGSTAKE